MTATVHGTYWVFSEQSCSLLSSPEMDALEPPLPAGLVPEPSDVSYPACILVITL